MGYYTDEELKRGYLRKDFIEAKYNFTDRMMRWGGVLDVQKPADGSKVKVLDVGHKHPRLAKPPFATPV